MLIRMGSSLIVAQLLEGIGNGTALFNSAVEKSAMDSIDALELFDQNVADFNALPRTILDLIRCKQLTQAFVDHMQSRQILLRFRQLEIGKQGIDFAFYSRN